MKTKQLYTKLQRIVTGSQELAADTNSHNNKRNNNNNIGSQELAAS